MVSVGDQLWDCGSEMGPLPLCCLTSSLFFLPQDDAGVLHASLTLSSLTSPTQERLPSPLPTGNHWLSILQSFNILIMVKENTNP